MPPTLGAAIGQTRDSRASFSRSRRAQAHRHRTLEVKATGRRAGELEQGEDPGQPKPAAREAALSSLTTATAPWSATRRPPWPGPARGQPSDWLTPHGTPSRPPGASPLATTMSGRRSSILTYRAEGYWCG